MEETDLIVPTFVLVLLTFIWVTGTPTVGSEMVQDVRTFTVDTNNVYLWEKTGIQHQLFSKKQIACTPQVYLINSTQLNTKGKVTPVVDEGDEGRCAVFETVDKTVVEIYGFEVVI